MYHMNYFTTVKFISIIPSNKGCKGFKIVEYLQFSKFIILINPFKVNGLISLIYITGSSLYFTTSLFFYFLTYKKTFLGSLFYTTIERIFVITQKFIYKIGRASWRERV